VLKYPINPITGPKPVYSQPRDNVFKYYNYMIVLFSRYGLLVCECDWLVYGVRDIIGD
jgi:hypothetical protein